MDDVTKSACTIFLEAIENRQPRERMAFVDSICGDDGQLREEVLRLLKAHDQLEGFMACPAAGALTIDEPSQRIGTMIGRYKLLEQIGEGGMGIVYLAEQTKPVRRQVALKIIKPGMDTRQVIARFEAERQVLAMMNHPNIASVLDAGRTGENEEGRLPDREQHTSATSAIDTASRPYFVMELVRGMPITEYCDKAKLDPKRRLELFITVCHAVQHAHQKGIIHRDLKPSNVLVTLHDGTPIPKIIDFGVAKAIGQQLSEFSLHTGFSQIIGTPLYMSPEQAEMSSLDVDTRSDVYALGVLLYELLTGNTPFDKQSLHEKGIDEMRRVIREDEPPRPSQRISTLDAQKLSTVSQKRSIDERQLRKLLRGELDWIVMKSLEKDRTRRYDSASALAADVQRYLCDQPIEASPPSKVYRLRKFVRRKRVAITAAAIVVLSLLTGTGLSVWQAVRATQAEARVRRLLSQVTGQRDRAITAERLADERLKEVLEQTKLAKDHADIAQAVNDFLLNELLGQASPELNPRSKKVTVEELLDRASERITGRFENQPRVEIVIQRTIGETYLQLGNFSAALPHLKRSYLLALQTLGEEDPETLVALDQCGEAQLALSNFSEAESLFSKKLEIQRRKYGDEHSNTLLTMSKLGSVYGRQGRWNLAEPLLLQSVAGVRRALGDEHDRTLETLNGLANLYVAEARFDEAEPLYRQVIDVRSRILGREHPRVLTNRMNLANMYQEMGRFDDAEKLLVEVLELQRAVHGDEHPETLHCLHHLGEAYIKQQRLEEAETLISEGLAISRRTLGDVHETTIGLLENLAWVYSLQGQDDQAALLSVQVLEGKQRLYGKEHQNTLQSVINLSQIYHRRQKYPQAEVILREALPTSRRVLGNQHQMTLQILARLATNQFLQNRVGEAEAFAAEALEGYRQVLGENHSVTLDSMLQLAEIYTKQRRFAEAEPLLRRRIVIDEESMSEGWMASFLKMKLGTCLLYQEKITEAESMLLAAYEQMKAVEHQLSPQAEALVNSEINRIGDVYAQLGHEEAAERWRARLDFGASKPPAQSREARAGP